METDSIDKSKVLITLTIGDYQDTTAIDCRFKSKEDVTHQLETQLQTMYMSFDNIQAGRT
jgi:hypothetical protein